MWTSSFAFSIGRPFTTSPSRMLKVAVVRPMPSANATTAMALRPELRVCDRTHRRVVDRRRIIGCLGREGMRSCGGSRTRRKPVVRGSDGGRTGCTQGEWRTSLHAIKIEDTARLTGLANRLVGQLNIGTTQSSGE